MYSTEMDGQPVEFGTSGLLYRSNKLMYDRRTQTLWRQFVGEPVVGPLAGSGIKLKMLPLSLTTWGAWVEKHPDTTVLSLDTGVYPRTLYRPEDNPRSIYSDYRRSSRTMFPVPVRNDELAVKEPVFGLLLDGQAKAYRISTLAGEQVINDTVGNVDVVIVADAFNVNGAAGQRAFIREDHSFSLAPAGQPGEVRLVDQSGEVWLVNESVLVREDGTKELARVAGRNAYWFGWYSAYPDTALFP